jgi:hypothetical protein
MTPTINPRARDAQSERICCPSRARAYQQQPTVDWRMANHRLNQQTAPKFRDHAFAVLHGEPTLTDNQRADLWSRFHAAKNTTELAAQLQPMPLRPDLKSQLLYAKNKPSIEYDALDKTVEAVKRLSTLDSKVLELAESHPAVMNALMSDIE